MAPAAVTCITLLECSVLGSCLVRALAPGPWQLFCGQTASSHFCYIILKEVTMETGMKMATGQLETEKSTREIVQHS